MASISSRLSNVVVSVSLAYSDLSTSFGLMTSAFRIDSTMSSLTFCMSSGASGSAGAAAGAAGSGAAAGSAAAGSAGASAAAGGSDGGGGGSSSASDKILRTRYMVSSNLNMVKSIYRCGGRAGCFGALEPNWVRAFMSTIFDCRARTGSGLIPTLVSNPPSSLLM